MTNSLKRLKQGIAAIAVMSSLAGVAAHAHADSGNGKQEASSVTFAKMMPYRK